jgi:S-adenosylmethionine:diacylglycerol 3-amino-3-carboxypropyl transferase
MFNSKRNQGDKNVRDNSISEDLFAFAATATGTLEVQARGSTLSPEVTSSLLAYLSRVNILSGFSEIVFDLRNVRAITPNWTLVLAMIMNFARYAGLRCRVVGLQAQPAAAVMMYRRNVELRALLAAA